jgi:hypothetical protein
MFCESRAFRSGESGRLALHFAVARATAGLLVLHHGALPMWLDAQVACCVPKGESQGEVCAGKKRVRFSPQEKSCTLQKCARATCRHHLPGKTLTNLPELNLAARGEPNRIDPNAVLHQNRAINGTESGHVRTAYACSGTRISLRGKSKKPFRAHAAPGASSLSVRIYCVSLQHKLRLRVAREPR